MWWGKRGRVSQIEESFFLFYLRGHEGLMCVLMPFDRQLMMLSYDYLYIMG